MKVYREISQRLNIHDNDICFQALNIKQLRDLDHVFRKTTNSKSNTMFETVEVYNKLLKDSGLDQNQLNIAEQIKKGRREPANQNEIGLILKYKKFYEEIDKIRKNKKFNFWNNRGLVKFSTIHSFKGWEVHTLILILEKDSSMQEVRDNHELIYTALTRCRVNLVILNSNNEAYHKFFTSQKLTNSK